MYIRRNPIVSCIYTLFVLILFSLQVQALEMVKPNSPQASLATQRMADFTSLVERTSPAVVSIITLDNLSPKEKLIPDDLRDQLENTPLMDLLKQIFGDQLHQKLYGGQAPGLGSGSIISEDGYIITNYHVVDGAGRIYIQTKDRTEFRAKIIGYDRGTDLALLKVDAHHLPFLRFSNEPVKVGQWVVAIGAPYGFEDTLTVGVVSAKRRSLGQEKYVPFIQTDVAINPGNSGGPLLNLDGEMVGLNSQIVSESGGFAGLSFAAPSHVIQNVVAQIKAQGFVERGWLGVAFQNLDRDLAEAFGLHHSSGALVSKVIDKSPAQKAGIQIGDVIVKLNGKNVRTASDVPPLVGLLPIGSQVDMDVIRKSKTVKLTLKTERAPMNKNTKALTVVKHPSVTDGIKVRDLEPGEFQGQDTKTEGVMVTHLQTTPWRAISLNVGDIILRVNDLPIKNAAHFYKTIHKMDKEKPISLLITSDGRIQKYVAVRLNN